MHFKSDTLSQSSPKKLPLKKPTETSYKCSCHMCGSGGHLSVSLRPSPLSGTRSFVVQHWVCQASWPTTFWKSPVISSHREEDLNY